MGRRGRTGARPRGRERSGSIHPSGRLRLPFEDCAPERSREAPSLAHKLARSRAAAARGVEACGGRRPSRFEGRSTNPPRPAACKPPRRRAGHTARARGIPSCRNAGRSSRSPPSGRRRWGGAIRAQPRLIATPRSRSARGPRRRRSPICRSPSRSRGPGRRTRAIRGPRRRRLRRPRHRNPRRARGSRPDRGRPAARRRGPSTARGRC